VETVSVRLALLFSIFWPSFVVAQPAPPELTQPVNDFAHVIDAESAAAMDRQIRALQKATGDVVVVAAIDTFAPYADIREYAVKTFENRGKGIGQRGKDNGVLVLLAVKDREVRVEVGYDLEQFITDGFAGETSRLYMLPAFKAGNYGAGLRAGVSRIIGRIAQARGVSIEGVQHVDEVAEPEFSTHPAVIIAIVIALMLFSAVGRSRRFRPRSRWGGGPWSGWNSGIGPFGGGGRIGGGGFGGGFGGFGGGRSGGGGGGARW
jgi:uncharacterized protein